MNDLEPIDIGPQYHAYLLKKQTEANAAARVLLLQYLNTVTTTVGLDFIPTPMLAWLLEEQVTQLLIAENNMKPLDERKSIADCVACVMKQVTSVIEKHGQEHRNIITILIEYQEQSINDLMHRPWLDELTGTDLSYGGLVPAPVGYVAVG